LYAVGPLIADECPTKCVEPQWAPHRWPAPCAVRFPRCRHNQHSADWACTIGFSGSERELEAPSTLPVMGSAIVAGASCSRVPETAFEAPATLPASLTCRCGMRAGLAVTGNERNRNPRSRQDRGVWSDPSEGCREGPKGEGGASRRVIARRAARWIRRGVRGDRPLRYSFLTEQSVGSA